jgi:putative transposase
MIFNLFIWTPYLSWLYQRLKHWTQPTNFSLVSGITSDLIRSRTDLLIENAMLRQQLIILNRRVKRPSVTKQDRLWMVLFARCTRFWKQAILVVQPETVLRWHRDLFRFYWRWKSRKKSRKPKVPPETVALIREMAENNRLWGAERIQGELLKLGIKVSKRTIQKYMPKGKKSHTSGQTWATFLKNHVQDIWACDFTVVYDWLFRPWYIFVIIELNSRKIAHTAVTRAPTDEWTAQQLREATPWGKGPKYLIRDRDKKYGLQFSRVASVSGINELKTPYRAPRANSICERYMGSLKRECLDQTLIFHGKQLRRVVREYTAYYNQDRPHQGIGQRIPEYYEREISSSGGKISSRVVLGGLYRSYSRAP